MFQASTLSLQRIPGVIDPDDIKNDTAMMMASAAYLKVSNIPNIMTLYIHIKIISNYAQHHANQIVHVNSFLWLSNLWSTKLSEWIPLHHFVTNLGAYKSLIQQNK